MEEGVRLGALAPGTALPPVRALAAQLGVSPGTVAAAYQVLRERGVVHTAGRHGTRIRERPPVTSRPTTAAASQPPPGVRNLASGNPDPLLLPELGQAIRAAADRHPRSQRYGLPMVSPLLAERAAPLLAADHVPTEALTVVSGALDAVERVLLARLSPGDTVAVEDPGYANLFDLLAALGLRTLPVAVDQAGPRPEALAAAVQAGADALVVTARAHNPVGAAITPERAERLRATLREHSPHLLVVEDDHAGPVAGVALTTLAGATTRWAHARSLAKAYGPDLRVALLAADPTTLAQVNGRLRLGHGWVSHLLQDTAAALLADPVADRQVADAAECYRRRRQALVAALAELGTEAYGHSGLNVWVPVREEAETVANLRADGWLVAAGSRFRLRSAPGIRVTVAELAVEQAPELAAAVVRAGQPGHSSQLA